VVADKPDSQEICFVGHGEHDEFVRRRRPGLDTAGQIVTTDGTVVGHHEGIESFTIGQRRGLGVAMGEPYFVVRIEADAQRVVIGRREQLACDELSASRVNWLIDPPAELHCLAQIRYNSSAEGATVRVNGDDRIEVRFDQPRHGVAPGQAVVLYDGDRVLGGGWIDTTGPASP
jgi:tRNA-specific 2-thiouridylase